MELISTITEKTINPAAVEVTCNKVFKRTAARAVVLGKDGTVYLLHVKKHNYHKIPGGGVEDGEDLKIALTREVDEEIGCDAKILSDVGQIIEHRAHDDGSCLEQTSYCFLAEQFGDEKEVNFTDSEKSEEFENIKVSNIDEAIRIFENDKPSNHEGEFIRLRDLTFLKAASKIISARK